MKREEVGGRQEGGGQEGGGRRQTGGGMKELEGNRKVRQEGGLLPLFLKMDIYQRALILTYYLMSHDKSQVRNIEPNQDCTYQPSRLVCQKYVGKSKGAVKMRMTVLKMCITCKQKCDRNVCEL